MDPLPVVVEAPEICISVLYLNFSPVCMEKGEWASWVQALGALIAIFFTIFQIWWTENQKNKSQLEKKEIVNAAISDYELRYGKETFNLVFQIRTIAQASGMFLRDPNHAALLDLHELTRAIKLQELPDTESVHRVLRLIKNIGDVRKMYMHAGRAVRGPLDNVKPEDLEYFARQLSPYVTEAKKIPGVDNN